MLNGSSTRMCKDGNWSESPPTCSGEAYTYIYAVMFCHELVPWQLSTVDLLNWETLNSITTELHTGIQQLITPVTPITLAVLQLHAHVKMYKHGSVQLMVFCCRCFFTILPI